MERMEPGQRVVVTEDSADVFTGKLGTVAELVTMEKTGEYGYFVRVDGFPDPVSEKGWPFKESELAPISDVEYPRLDHEPAVIFQPDQ